MTVWESRAVCRDHDPDMWFPAKSDRLTRQRAQQICRSCPVVIECARHALETGVPEGIWGGLTAKERSRILGVPARYRMIAVASRLPCGTYAAYRRHRANNEPVCPPCAAAHTAYNSERAAQKRKKRAAV